MTVTTEFALQVQVSGEKRIVGKVVKLGDKRVLYRDFAWKSSYHKNTDSLSMDEKLAAWLEVHYEVTEIHVVDPATDRLFVVSRDKFLESAQNDNFGDGAQRYLGLDQWEKIEKRPYPAPRFTMQVRRLA